MRRFDRLDPERLALAAEVVGRARPDCAEAADALLERLADGPPESEPVHLHGDANLRNALLDGERVGLVDLEDATAGPPAADLGFVLAGLLAREEEGAALLDGYAADRARAVGRGAALAHRGVAAGADRGAGGRARAPGAAAPPRTPAARGGGAGGMNGRPTLLWYCQHSVGLGHLIRSYALCTALAERFRVVLLCGGAVPEGIRPPAGVELLPLPPLGVGPAGGFVSHDAALLARRGVGGAARAHPRRLPRAAARGGGRRAVPVRAREVRARARAAARGRARATAR